MHLRMPLLAAIQPEFLLFGGAVAISLLAFTALILAPAMGSFGRAWEKAMAGVLSLFVLAVLVVIGLGVGLAVVQFWPEISRLFG